MRRSTSAMTLPAGSKNFLVTSAHVPKAEIENRPAGFGNGWGLLTYVSRGR